MGNQIMPSELPPLDITEEESGLATVRVNRSGYPAHSAAYYNTAELVCRERQLREALAQLRAANERAEELAGYVLNLRAELASTRVDAERELEEERELCDAIAQQRQRLELQVTELETKLAALLEPKE